MSKILKCCTGDDSVTIKADDDGDTASFVFESKKGERYSEFELKLMDIDAEHLGIPETGERVCWRLVVCVDCFQL